MKQNLRFRLVLGWPSVLKISTMWPKYATFEGIILFHVFMEKTNTKLEFLCTIASSMIID